MVVVLKDSFPSKQESIGGSESVSQGPTVHKRRSLSDSGGDSPRDRHIGIQRPCREKVTSHENRDVRNVGAALSGQIAWSLVPKSFGSVLTWLAGALLLLFICYAALASIEKIQENGRLQEDLRRERADNQEKSANIRALTQGQQRGRADNRRLKKDNKVKNATISRMARDLQKEKTDNRRLKEDSQVKSDEINRLTRSLQTGNEDRRRLTEVNQSQNREIALLHERNNATLTEKRELEFRFREDLPKEVKKRVKEELKKQGVLSCVENSIINTFQGYIAPLSIWLLS